MFNKSKKDEIQNQNVPEAETTIEVEVDEAQNLSSEPQEAQPMRDEGVTRLAQSGRAKWRYSQSEREEIERRVLNGARVTLANL